MYTKNSDYHFTSNWWGEVGTQCLVRITKQWKSWIFHLTTFMLPYSNASKMSNLTVLFCAKAIHHASFHQNWLSAKAVENKIFVLFKCLLSKLVKLSAISRFDAQSLELLYCSSTSLTQKLHAKSMLASFLGINNNGNFCRLHNFATTKVSTVSLVDIWRKRKLFPVDTGSFARTFFAKQA